MNGHISCCIFMQWNTMEHYRGKKFQIHASCSVEEARHQKLHTTGVCLHDVMVKAKL